MPLVSFLPLLEIVDGVLILAVAIGILTQVNATLLKINTWHMSTDATA
jgi:hypothetical protein